MKSYSFLQILCLSCLYLLCTATFSFADTKVATVDLTQVVNQTEEAQEVRKQLNKMTEDARAKLAKKQEALQSMEKELKESGAKEDSEPVERFRVEVRNFERLAKDSEEEIKNKFFQTNKKLTDTAIKIVEKYAKENKIDLVLDINQKASGPILFGSEKIDITKDIIELID